MKNTESWSLASDGLGNLYAYCRHYSTTNFQPWLTAISHTYRAVPGLDGFVVKYGLDEIVTISNVVQRPLFLIYPNPTFGQISITLEKAKTGVLRVRNSLGQLVLEEGFNITKDLVINLDTPSGLYFLQLQVDGQTIAFKFLLFKTILRRFLNMRFSGSLVFMPCTHLAIIENKEFNLNSLPLMSTNKNL